VDIGKGPGTEYEIPTPRSENDRIFLGRDPFCQLRFNDHELSRRHCEFRIEGNRLYVEDLSSLNGIKVNGRRVKEKKEINDGDLIVAGGIRLRVRLELGVEADEEVAKGSVRKAIKIPLTREMALKRSEEPEHTDPLVGSVFAGSYNILNILSSSDAATVYKAQDVSRRRTVAIKIPKGDLELTDAQKSRFVRGTKRAVSVRHRNLARIYRGGNHHGVLYVIMEYVEGKTLKPVIDENPIGLGIKLATTIGIQMLNGLVALHQKGLVHRNLNPENIIIGDDGILRIVDFDILKACGAADYEEEETITPGSTESLLMDYHYSAPEMLTNPGGVDHRCDIYSAGAVLYHTATGVSPFGEVPPSEWMTRVLELELPAPKSLKPSVPESWSEAILKAMSPERADRYQTPSEFIAALQRAKADL